MREKLRGTCTSEASKPIWAVLWFSKPHIRKLELFLSVVRTFTLYTSPLFLHFSTIIPTLSSINNLIITNNNTQLFYSLARLSWLRRSKLKMASGARQIIDGQATYRSLSGGNSAGVSGWRIACPRPRDPAFEPSCCRQAIDERYQRANRGRRSSRSGRPKRIGEIILFAAAEPLGRAVRWLRTA